ncbi:putative metal-binding motif-containing protein [Myxococcota bacterium]|nr:putative metal-binding motif-containing protein [Myxococcota bacterium]
MDNPIQLNVAREGARATYVETEYDETDPDAVTGALFILGGRSGFMSLSGSEDTIERIGFMNDGTLVGPGIQQVRMVTGRSFFGLGNSQSRLDNLTFEEEDDDDPVTPDCLDGDSDGFFDATCGGTDCDDTNILINPAAWENLQNGIDDNCDGLVDVPTQGWDSPPPDGGKVVIPRMARALDPDPEPVFLIAMLGNDNVLASNDTGLNDIEAIGVDLYTGELMELNQTPSLLWTVQTNTDNSLVHGVNIALYQKYLFSFMGVGSENLGQVPGNLIAQSKRFPYCPPPEPDDPGDSSFGCPGYTGWTYKDLAGQKRTSANATVSGGLGYYGLARAFGYIYLVAGVNSSGVSNGTWRVLQ